MRLPANDNKNLESASNAVFNEFPSDVESKTQAVILQKHVWAVWGGIMHETSQPNRHD